MSYSFLVVGATKKEALEKATAELEKVAASQPIHEADQRQAESAIAAFIGVLNDDPTKEVLVSCNGSISAQDGRVYSANISISTSLKPK